MPIVLNEAPPACKLRGSHMEPSFEPVAHDPDGLADLARSRLLRDWISDHGQVIGKAAARRLGAAIVPERPHHLEVVLAPGNDPSITMFGAEHCLRDRVVQGHERGSKARERPVDDVVVHERCRSLACAAQDAQEDGEFVLLALEVDIEGDGALRRPRAA
jgi:hypothetical protein